MILRSKNLYFVILIILIGIIPLIDLFHTGIPITHDGQDHVARIANFYQNLQEGVLIPRWAANLNWGFGHPILMFLYPLPSYLASFFHFLGFRLEESVKIVFGLTYIFSGLSMYFFVRNFLAEEEAFFAGVLYMFAPYRFVDMYVRGAIGEHVAFMFLPLVMYFLLKLSKRFSYWYVFFGSFSLGGLILSHNAISIMFLPIVLFFFVYLFWRSKLKREFVISFLLLLFFGFCITAFFWFPAYFEGRYTLRDIVAKSEYKTRFVSINQLVFGPWNYGNTGQFTVQLGIVQLFLSFATIPITILLFKKKDPKWIICSGVFFVLILTLFLMTEYSLFVWESIKTLQKFQFPWRFLSIAVFLTAILGAIFSYMFPKRYKIFFVFGLVLFLLFLNTDFWHAKGYLVKEESFYSGIYSGTTDTGESSPIWSVRFMEKRPKIPLEVIDGEATTKQLYASSTSYSYKIDALKKSRIKKNTLYFPGWTVLINGKHTNVEFQDPNHRGLITFWVNEGNSYVNIIFKDTKLRLFANGVSIIGVTGLFLSIFLLQSKKTFLTS